uniref:Uncharacterized protein n=1 Tax=Pseudomonas phage RVTF4 TaxID=3236931 RepID=A0AB39CC84_9VIRU
MSLMKVEIRNKLLHESETMADGLVEIITTAHKNDAEMVESIHKGEDGTDRFTYRMPLTVYISEQSHTLKRLAAGLEDLGFSNVNIRGVGDLPREDCEVRAWLFYDLVLPDEEAPSV